MFKRTLCLLLALLAIAGNLPVFAFAAEEEPTETLSSEIDGVDFPDGNVGMAKLIQDSPYFQYYYWDMSGKETEKNNSLATANVLPVSSYKHIAVRGEIHSKKDTKDFYKFTITDTMYLKLLCYSGHPWKHSQFRLYNSDGEALKTASYKGKLTAAKDTLYYLEYSLNPGTYYIRAYEPKKSGYSWVKSDYLLFVHLHPRLDKPAFNDTTFVAATGKPTLSWNAVEDAHYYKIFRATSKDGTYYEKATVTDTSWTDTATKAGKSYYYKIQAFSDDTKYTESKNQSSKSSYKKVICDCAQPVIVDASYENGKLYLDWDKVSGATSYKIYRYNTTTGESKLIKTTEKTSYTYSKALKEPYGYYVRACAKSKYSYSAWSTIVVIANQ